jgi:hypothetical protein
MSEFFKSVQEAHRSGVIVFQIWGKETYSVALHHLRHNARLIANRSDLAVQPEAVGIVKAIAHSGPRSCVDTHTQEG